MNTGIDETVSAAPKTITGLGLDFRQHTSGSFHIVWDGTLEGTPTLEANNDPTGFPNSWEVVTKVTFQALGGAPGKQLAEISGMRSNYYRLVVPITAGTGAIKAVATGKRG